MTLKNIGVFVDATPEGEKRIDYAATLAHQCGAHLAGIHVVSAVRPEHRSDYYVIGEKAIRAWLGARSMLCSRTSLGAVSGNFKRASGNIEPCGGARSRVIGLRYVWCGTVETSK